MFCQLAEAAATPKRSALILPFIPRPKPKDDSVIVAAVLLALEEEPLFPPVILAARGMDGVHYVGASIGRHAFRLTPGEARLAGDSLWADPSICPGFADVVARFRDAADASDRAFLRSGT